MLLETTTASRPLPTSYAPPIHSFTRSPPFALRLCLPACLPACLLAAPARLTARCDHPPSALLLLLHLIYGSALLLNHTATTPAYLSPHTRLIPFSLSHPNLLLHTLLLPPRTFSPAERFAEAPCLACLSLARRQSPAQRIPHPRNPAVHPNARVNTTLPHYSLPIIRSYLSPERRDRGLCISRPFFSHGPGDASTIILIRLPTQTLLLHPTAFAYSRSRPPPAWPN